jgi:hypothetical protein
MRLLDRRSSRNGENRSELDRTPDCLNWLLEQALRAEAAFLRGGRRIPACLSLMAVFSAEDAT